MNPVEFSGRTFGSGRSPSVRSVLILHQGDRTRTAEPMIVHAATTAADIAASLSRCGKTVTELLLEPERLRFASDILDARPDIVFNLCDLGAYYCERFEPHVVSALELLRVPFTGSNAVTLALTDDKMVCKRLLASHGIPTPPFVLADADYLEVDLDVGLPVICKPVDQHNSVGVNFDSVFYDAHSLRARMSLLEGQGGHWLLDRYIDGREIIGAFVGNGSSRVVLPFEEIVFGDHFAGRPKVLTWDAKWAEDSPECTDSRPVVPASLDVGLKETLKKALLAVADVFRIQDYGRVDFRIDSDGGVWAIDVNANPDVGRDAGLFLMASHAGFTYEGFVNAIVESALSRSGLS